MRRSRTVDWILIGTLVPIWLGLLGFEVERQIRWQGARFNVLIESAAGAANYPTVDIVLPTDVSLPDSGARGPQLRAGDRVLRMGDSDLRGVSTVGFGIRATALWRATGTVPLEVERDGARFATAFAFSPDPFWWAALIFPAGMLVCAVILLLRARDWRLARRFFGGAILLALGWTASVRPTPESLALALIAVLGIGPGSALVLSIWWEFTDSALPLRPWQRALPWVFAAALTACHAAIGWLPALPGRHLTDPMAAIIPLFFGACLLGLTRSYRRSNALERRQLRWVLFSLYLSVVPYSLVNGLSLFAFGWVTPVFFAIGILAQAALPLGILVSILGYRLLDIDRIWGATASYTVLGIAVLALTLVLAPQIAGAASATLGVSPEVSQWLVALGLAAGAVVGNRKLRPWLDRRMFAERVAVEAGLERLVGELGRCTAPRDLIQRAGEAIDALLEPESIATYGREDAAFTPVFARGQAVPPAFKADGLLAKTLALRATPLSARAAELGSFDRAALETLRAEVIVPTRRGASLVAFTCLGRKRSGDIYTPAELALLAAIASKSGELLQGMSDAEILSESRAMQESLRRYVPGAVAEQLQGGRDLAAGEREVSVVFVDVRGYTSFAESRSPEDVFSTLNEHTERVSRIVREHGGAVVEFNGDGMMAVFGAPEPLAEKERRAVEAAREIVEKLATGLKVGVGVATGPAYTGNIRAVDRWIWSVIGSTTNLAARLQGLTRELGASIAVDVATQQAAGWVCGGFVRHEGIPIRGRSDRRDVWALPLAG